LGRYDVKGKGSKRKGVGKGGKENPARKKGEKPRGGATYEENEVGVVM